MRIERELQLESDTTCTYLIAILFSLPVLLIPSFYFLPECPNLPLRLDSLLFYQIPVITSTLSIATDIIHLPPHTPCKCSYVQVILYFKIRWMFLYFLWIQIIYFQKQQQQQKTLTNQSWQKQHFFITSRGFIQAFHTFLYSSIVTLQANHYSFFELQQESSQVLLDPHDSSCNMVLRGCLV